jgi:hypothetical protein
MKILITQSLIGLFLLLPIYAEEIQVESLSEPSSNSIEPIRTPTIQELLLEVKNAPDEQKRVLMNQLKVQLKSMNQESRKKVMIELKKSFGQGEETHEPQHEKQQNHEGCQQTNHQPKFRHLRRASKDGGLGSHGGQGNGKK